MSALKAELRDRWNAGFAIACVELATTHGEDSLAAMLLRNAGLTVEMCGRAKLDADDLSKIEDILKDN